MPQTEPELHAEPKAVDKSEPLKEPKRRDE